MKRMKLSKIKKLLEKGIQVELEHNARWDMEARERALTMRSVLAALNGEPSRLTVYEQEYDLLDLGES